MLKSHTLPPLRGLYVITDAHLGGGHLAMARAALAGGAQILQLRDKELPARQLLLIARQIRVWTWPDKAIFLINDNVELAMACEADGVHLGQSDLPIAQARRVLGSGKIIGVSARTPELARLAERGGANYLGVGAVFGTATKLDAGAAIGTHALRAVVDATTLPVAAIGGVNAGNIASVFEAGAAMACVISALCAGNGANNARINAPTPVKAAQINAARIESSMTQRARELVALCDAGPGR